MVIVYDYKGYSTIYTNIVNGSKDQDIDLSEYILKQWGFSFYGIDVKRRISNLFE